MVATGTVEEPTESGTYKRIRTHLKRRDANAHRRCRWHVRRSLRDAHGLSCRTNAAAQTSCRIRTNLRPGHVSVHAGQNVIALAAHVADLQHEVSRNLTLYCERPLLKSGRFQYGIYTSRDKDRTVRGPQCRLSVATGRDLFSKRNWNNRKQRHARKRQP